ncbi:hypothetical protein [Desulfatirhabdium butyrativorans]|uniref:hypothetical protein n=1 Tax=Desulfatirhabdium butyrativorans TaxID=340467 RepID=UPI0004141404|nr:hypothetical protein [Desulfatirhabdium butyrativorans]
MKHVKWLVILLALILGAGLAFAQPGTQAQNRISAMDTNGDGKVSRDEYMANCKLGDCAKQFDRLDTNHDGFLTPEEMEIKQTEPTEKEKEAARKFQELIKSKLQQKP